MAVSGVAEDFRGAFRRLFFLLVLVSGAAAVHAGGLNECYERLYESLNHVIREPFLAAPASYWYRLSQAHNRDASSLLLSPIEAPMVDLAYGKSHRETTVPPPSGLLSWATLILECSGSAGLVNPMQAYTGSLDHHHL